MTFEVVCKKSSAKFAKQPKIRQKFGSFGANLEFCLTAAKFRSGKRKTPKALIYKDFGAFALEVPPRFELGNRGFAGRCAIENLLIHKDFCLSSFLNSAKFGKIAHTFKVSYRL